MVKTTAGALLLLAAGLVTATPYQRAQPAARLERRALSPYAPLKANCPANEQLVRPATGIAQDEASFVAARKPVADAALKTFLANTGVGFTDSCDKYPTLGLTTSGGGLRSLLCGAGVHQGLDSRDSNVSTKGLYQAFTYEAGLSGGAWLLSSIAANNWPTITSLKDNLWQQSFQDTLLDPETLFASAAYVQIVDDIAAKEAAGFQTTLVDPYGRLLSYQLLTGLDGGVSDRVSGLTQLANFSSHQVPFPIFSSLGVAAQTGVCLPTENATQYEFNPYEFGSWDSGVHAFMQIEYLGSDLTNGQPTTAGQCIINYDNQGFVLGTSSNLFNELCGFTDLPNSTLPGALQTILDDVHADTSEESFALYPNPFKGYTAQSPLVAGQSELTLVDGGEANQNNPIWPFLHRPHVKVLVVNDNSADTSENYPNGTELLTTYQQAQAVGGSVAARMPSIPPAETFVSEGLNKRPTFFGCNSSSNNSELLTIIWLPNTDYTFNSGQSTFRLQYDPATTDAMIANGEMIASYNNSATFPTCLGCAIIKKVPEAQPLPAPCAACFAEFCYN